MSVSEAEWLDARRRAAERRFAGDEDVEIEPEPRQLSVAELFLGGALAGIALATIIELLSPTSGSKRRR